MISEEDIEELMKLPYREFLRLLPIIRSLISDEQREKIDAEYRRAFLEMAFRTERGII